jgi:heptosyltransferase-2
VTVPDVRRLIVRAPNWLGDAVMALPAMAAARAAHRTATLIVAAHAGIAPLFREETDVAPDEILVVDRERETGQLRAANADAVLLLPNSFGSAWTARRAAVRERWGYRAGGRGWMLTRAVRRPHGRVHQVDYYLGLVRGLGWDTPETVPRIRVSAASRARADQALEFAGVRPGDRLIGFAPGAAYGNAKRWPPDRVALVAAAASSHGFVPVLVGAAADRETGRAIESSLPPDVRVANLIGRTTLGELAGVAARCAAFASNDSGAMHVAAALGVPLAAIFGPTDERVTSPAGPGRREILLHDVFCRPCMLRECPIDHRCMRRISVERVIAEIGELVNW